MAIAFNTQNGSFKLVVSAMLIHEGKLLIGKPDFLDYFSLPVECVTFAQSAEEAVLDLVKERFQIEAAELVGPVAAVDSLVENSRADEINRELVLYFQVDVSDSRLVEQGQTFRIVDETSWIDYAWIPFEELKACDLYPEFLRDASLYDGEKVTYLTERSYF